MYSKYQDRCVSGGPEFRGLLGNHPVAHIPTRMGFHSGTMSWNKLVQGCRLVVFVLGRHGNHITLGPDQWRMTFTADRVNNINPTLPGTY